MNPSHITGTKKAYLVERKVASSKWLHRYSTQEEPFKSASRSADALTLFEAALAICCFDTQKDVSYQASHYTNSIAPAENRETYFSCLTNELLDMSRLKEGWDSYSAPPPSALARGKAFSFVASLRDLDLRPSKVVPSVIGGIAVSFIRGLREVFVEFYNDGNVLCGMLEEGSEPEIIEVSENNEDWSDLLSNVEKHLNG